MIRCAIPKLPFNAMANKQRQLAGVVISMLVMLTSLPEDVDALSWGRGMLGGLGGFGPRFKRPPPGPVFLLPANGTTRWGDILEDTLQHAVDHCKTVRLCNATGIVTNYDARCSECHPCSCDSACYLRGDCCVDKLLRDASGEFVLTSTPRLQQLSNPASSSSSAAAVATGASSSYSFSCLSTGISHPTLAKHAFMVDKCPGVFNDDEVVNRCMLGSPSASNVVPTHWPVWSGTSATAYRNADCALCNGEDVSQTVPWNLLIQCEKSLHLGDMGNQTEVIERVLAEPDCLLSFAHPKGSHRSPSCWPKSEEYVDACNVTGRRREFDEVLWKACEVFHGEMTVAKTTYKNVFCAMCNEEEVPALGECEDQVEFPFFLELNVSVFLQAVPGGMVGGRGADGDGAVQSGERCGCNDDEIYDKYERECLPLHCSMTRALHKGQCRPLVANGSGLSYDVAVSLTPENVTVFLKDTTTLKRVARNIRTAFVLQSSSSSGWDVQIDHFRVITHVQKVANSEIGPLKITHFTVHIKFFSLWPEPAVDLEARLFALTSSLWNISVAGRPKQSFRAAPYHVNRKAEIGGRFFPDVSLLPSPSLDAGGSLEYAVDIPDRLIRGPDSLVLQSDTYLPIREVLRCAKIAFRLPNTTDNGGTTGSRAMLVVNETSGTVRHVPSDTLIRPELVQLGEGDGEYLVCADAIFSRLDITTIHIAFRNSFITPQDGEGASAACTTVSVIALFLALLTFLLFPELRTLTGKSTMGFVSTLLLTLVLVETEAHVEAATSSRFCLALGVSAHFFLLSSFMWILLCTCHSFRRAAGMMETSSTTISSSPVTRKKGSDHFARYVGFSVTIPLLIVAATLIGNFLVQRTSCGSTYLGYGAGICFTSDPWSASLGLILPICLVLLSVGLLYLFAARRGAHASAASLTDDANTLDHGKTSSRRPYRRDFVVSVGLSVLMAVTWLVGLMAVVMDVWALRYVFLVLRPALAFAVLAAVVCNRDVMRLYNAMCCSWKKKERCGYNHKFTAVDT